MVSSNDWTPVTILLRKHLGLLALLPFLLWSCQADDPTAHGEMSEPGVLASGYWIPDGIAVIGEGEFLFADRGGALYHYKGGGVTEVRGLPPSRTSGVFGGLLDVSLHPRFSRQPARVHRLQRRFIRPYGRALRAPRRPSRAPERDL